MAHTHHVYDDDQLFTIDPNTRVITNPTGTRLTLMQYDHNSESIMFKLPRHIEAHDMMLCNQIQVHYINIGENGERNTGIYEVTDLEEIPVYTADDEEYVTCSWLISRNATSLVGSLSFIVRFSCVTEDSVDYSWNTAIFNDISISNGINNTEVIVEEYADILMQWSLELERMGMVIDGLAESTVTQEDIAEAIKQNRVFYGASTSTSDLIDVYLDTPSKSRWDRFRAGDMLFVYLQYGFPVGDPTVDVYLSTGWTGYLSTATTYNRNTNKRSSIRANHCRLGSTVLFIYDSDFGGWVAPFLSHATTTYYGLVKLNNTVTSTSTEEAATAAAVKKAYDKAVEASNSGGVLMTFMVNSTKYYTVPGMTWGEFIDSAFNPMFYNSEHGYPTHQFFRGYGGDQIHGYVFCVSDDINTVRDSNGDDVFASDIIFADESYDLPSSFE